jgi:nucleoside-diphosphate-sugar epimerase
MTTGRVTVVGGSGYIGTHLVSHLERAGHQCWVPERNDPDLFKRTLGTVYYVAGLTADFRTRPFATVDSHVGLVRELLEHGHFEQLVYFSSTRVYVGADGTQEDQTLSVQTQSADDLYKLSKLMGECLALSSGRDCKVVRLSNVVGGAGGNPDSFVYSLLREAKDGAVVLRSDPESAKDYIHIDDVVRLIPQIAEKGAHRVYNVATGMQITNKQWLDAICTSTASTWTVAPCSPKQVFPPIDISRIQNEFGFTAVCPLATFPLPDMARQPRDPSNKASSTSEPDCIN